MGSYVDIIKHKMISFDGTMDSNVNQMRVQYLYKDDIRIGAQLSYRGDISSSGNQWVHYARGNDADTQWVFRTYTDGTAYLYPTAFHNLNYNTHRNITNLIEDHYRVLKRVETITDEGYTRRLIIYKRKSDNRLASEHLIMNGTFSQFLATKFNDEETT